MNNEQIEQLIITACRVEDDNRMEFLPEFFGESLMLKGEGLVYNWMRRLSEDYQGGLWQFYHLSNGGFYMAPDLDRKLVLCVPGNWFQRELSADAAGIVATLFVLCQLANTTEDDRLIDLYYKLKAYLDFHPEGGLIAQAID